MSSYATGGPAPGKGSASLPGPGAQSCDPTTSGAGGGQAMASPGNTQGGAAHPGGKGSSGSASSSRPA